MKTKIYGILFSAAMFTILSFPASAQNPKDLAIIRETNKVALVIGNSDYQNGFNKLSSPKNDAAAMAAALKRLGFRLIGGKAHIDTSFAEMDDLLDKFTDELKTGGIGFFYFSGHGSQNAKRENYLIPVDTKISFQSDLTYKAMQVEQITSRMEQTGNILNILVLDACRNNPLPSGTKSAGKGLNPNNYVPGGVYIAFAARDGQTALDGDTGGYSLYTRELLKNIETTDERLEDVFIKTRIAVKSETKNQQFPIDYGSIDGRFYFNPNPDLTRGNTSALNSSNNSENEECTTCITKGPSILKNKYFIVNKVKFIFYALTINYNDTSDINKEIGKASDNKTHDWDNKWYYLTLSKDDSGLLLFWKNETESVAGWIFIQRDRNDKWIYKTNDDEWKFLEVGKEESIVWTSTPVKIYIKAPNLVGGCELLPKTRPL